MKIELSQFVVPRKMYVRGGFYNFFKAEFTNLLSIALIFCKQSYIFFMVLELG